MTLISSYIELFVWEEKSGGKFRGGNVRIPRRPTLRTLRCDDASTYRLSFITVFTRFRYNGIAVLSVQSFASGCRTVGGKFRPTRNPDEWPLCALPLVVGSASESLSVAL